MTVNTGDWVWYTINPFHNPDILNGNHYDAIVPFNTGMPSIYDIKDLDGYMVHGIIPQSQITKIHLLKKLRMPWHSKWFHNNKFGIGTKEMLCKSAVSTALNSLEEQPMKEELTIANTYKTLSELKKRLINDWSILVFQCKGMKVEIKPIAENQFYAGSRVYINNTHEYALKPDSPDKKLWDELLADPIFARQWTYLRAIDSTVEAQEGTSEGSLVLSLLKQIIDKKIDEPVGPKVWYAIKKKGTDKVLKIIEAHGFNEATAKSKKLFPKLELSTCISTVGPNKEVKEASKAPLKKITSKKEFKKKITRGLNAHKKQIRAVLNQNQIKCIARPVVSTRLKKKHYPQPVIHPIREHKKEYEHIRKICLKNSKTGDIIRLYQDGADKLLKDKPDLYSYVSKMEWKKYKKEKSKPTRKNNIIPNSTFLHRKKKEALNAFKQQRQSVYNTRGQYLRSNKQTILVTKEVDVEKRTYSYLQPVYEKVVKEFSGGPGNPPKKRVMIIHALNLDGTKKYEEVTYTKKHLILRHVTPVTIYHTSNNAKANATTMCGRSQPRKKKNITPIVHSNTFKPKENKPFKDSKKRPLPFKTKVASKEKSSTTETLKKARLHGLSKGIVFDAIVDDKVYTKHALEVKRKSEEQSAKQKIVRLAKIIKTKNKN